MDVTSAPSTTAVAPTATPYTPTIYVQNPAASALTAVTPTVGVDLPLIASSDSAAPASFTITYSDPDSFTIIVRNPVKLNDLTIASSIGEEWFQRFNFIGQNQFMSQPGTCFQFIRYQSHPPLYHECDPNQPQSVISLTVGGSEVFWYNSLTNRFLQTIIKYGQEQLGVCNGGDEVCNFSVNE